MYMLCTRHLSEKPPVEVLRNSEDDYTLLKDAPDTAMWGSQTLTRMQPDYEPDQEKDKGSVLYNTQQSPSRKYASNSAVRRVNDYGATA